MTTRTPTQPATHLRVAVAYLATFQRLASQPQYTTDDKRQASVAFLNLHIAESHLLAALHDLERVQ